MNVKLSVGLNDKDTKRQVFDAFTAENIIYDILQNRKVDGCTMDTARGSCCEAAIRLALSVRQLSISIAGFHHVGRPAWQPFQAQNPTL